MAPCKLGGDIVHHRREQPPQHHWNGLGQQSIDADASPSAKVHTPGSAWAEHQPTLLVADTATHESPAPPLPDILGNPDD